MLAITVYMEKIEPLNENPKVIQARFDWAFDWACSGTVVISAPSTDLSRIHLKMIISNFEF